MAKKLRIIVVPLLITSGLIFYIITREGTMFILTLSVAVEGIPLVARDLKPELIPKIVIDIAGFISFSILYWLWFDPVIAAQTQMDTALGIRVLGGILYLGACVYFAYKVYAYLKGRRQEKSG